MVSTVSLLPLLTENVSRNSKDILPQELWAKVAHYLPPRDLQAMALVDRDIRSAIIPECNIHTYQSIQQFLNSLMKVLGAQKYSDQYQRLRQMHDALQNPFKEGLVALKNWTLSLKEDLLDVCLSLDEEGIQKIKAIKLHTPFMEDIHELIPQLIKIGMEIGLILNQNPPLNPHQKSKSLKLFAEKLLRRNQIIMAAAVIQCMPGRLIESFLEPEEGVDRNKIITQRAFVCEEVCEAFAVRGLLTQAWECIETSASREENPELFLKIYDPIYASLVWDCCERADLVGARQTVSRITDVHLRQHAKKYLATAYAKHYQVDEGIKIAKEIEDPRTQKEAFREILTTLLKKVRGEDLEKALEVALLNPQDKTALLDVCNHPNFLNDISFAVRVIAIIPSKINLDSFFKDLIVSDPSWERLQVLMRLITQIADKDRRTQALSHFFKVADVSQNIRKIIVFAANLPEEGPERHILKFFFTKLVSSNRIPLAIECAGAIFDSSAQVYVIDCMYQVLLIGDNYDINEVLSIANVIHKLDEKQNKIKEVKRFHFVRELVKELPKTFGVTVHSHQLLDAIVLIEQEPKMERRLFLLEYFFRNLIDAELIDLAIACVHKIVESPSHGAAVDRLCHLLLQKPGFDLHKIVDIANTISDENQRRQLQQEIELFAQNHFWPKLF